MRSCVEPEEADDDLDPHLYLFTASCFLEGLVKIGRSHRVFERACQLQESMLSFYKFVPFGHTQAAEKARSTKHSDHSVRRGGQAWNGTG